MTVNVNIIFPRETLIFEPWKIRAQTPVKRKVSREDFGLKVASEDGREDFAKFKPVTKKKSGVKNFEENR